jgi:hypothetical protein
MWFIYIYLGYLAFKNVGMPLTSMTQKQGQKHMWTSLDRSMNGWGSYYKKYECLKNTWSLEGS